MTSTTLSAVQQQADLLKQIIPAAIKDTTAKLDKIISFATDDEKQTLDDFFGVGGNSAVDKTKVVAPIFNPSLAKIAKLKGLDYISEEAVGYDAKCLESILTELDSQLENKLSMGTTPSQFATGNNHSKSKVDKIFCVKLEQVGNTFTAGFACIIDLSKATHKDTGFDDKVTKTGKNNNGFSALRVHIDDVDCITVIHGSIRCHKLNSSTPTTYVQIDYAPFAE